MITFTLFVNKAIKKFGNKYTYLESEYINSTTLMTIICPEHGLFKLCPKDHLRSKYGCPNCSIDNRSNNIKNKMLDEFIQRASIVHQNKYDYSKVNYINCKTKVIITCPIHGDFELIPSSHLSGNGCPVCGIDSIRRKLTLSLEEFIKRANIIHNNYYNYSKIDYINTNTKMCIICPVHGEFWLTPHDHLLGQGCQKCGNIKKSESNKDTTESFINKSRLIHGNKYNYDKVSYINNKTKVCIICPEHGEFWQMPSDHLQNKGCPICKYSHGENLIFNILNSLLIQFIPLYKIINNIFSQSCIYVDFYLPDYNIFIEYNGELHYKPIKYFGGELKFEKQQLRDNQLLEYCDKNNIELIWIDYNKTDDEITSIIKQINHVQF